MGRYRGTRSDARRRMLLAATVAAMGAAGGVTAIAAAPDAGAPDTAAFDALAPADHGVIGEITSLRTRTSKTYATRSGAYLAELFASSVHFRDGGAWRPIDNTLVRNRRGDLQNRANRFGVQFPRHTAAGPISIARGRSSMSLRLRGARAARGSAQRASVRYDGVYPGVDVRYDVLPDAVKETLILESPDVERAYVFDVRASAGLSLRAARGGGAKVVGPRGDAPFTIAPPVAWDASGDAAPPGAVTLQVVPGRRGMVALRVSDAYLRDPSRRFPVSVDPFLSVPLPTKDCTLSELAGEQSTSFCASPELHVGRVDGHDHHLAVDFNVASQLPPGVTLMEGYFRLFVQRQEGTTWQTLRTHGITRPWTNNEVSWLRASAATAWTTPGGDFEPTPANIKWVGGSGSPGKWQYFAIPDLIESWMYGRIPDYGALLKMEPADPSTGLVFSSSEDADPSRRPSATVWYEPKVGLQRQFTYVAEDLGTDVDVRVNVANGNLAVRENDIDLNSSILDLRADRYYNSLTPESAPLGRGWKLGDFDVRLEHMGNDDQILRDSSGARSRFAMQPDGTFRPPFGVAATLASSSGGFVLTRTTTGETLTFDSSGRLIRVERTPSDSADLAYDANGRLSTVIDRSARDDDGRTVLTYDAAGNLASVVSPGASATYTLENGYLKSRTVGTRTTTYSYGSNGKMTRLQSPSGSVKFTYDGQNRVVSVTRVTDPVADTGPTTQLAYTAQGTTLVTRPDGTATTYRYDRDLQAYAPDSTGPTIEEPDPGEQVVVNAGQSTAEVDVEVRDDVQGTRRVRLERADGSVAVEKNGLCRRVPGTTTDVCERQLNTTLVFSTSALPAGRHPMTLRATDAGGRDSTRAIDLIVDKAAPTAPDDVDVVAVDALAAQATLGIDPGEDPDAADGSPGAGIAYSELRWRRPNGVYSGWIRTDDDVGVTIAGISQGETIEVEARSIDRAANTSTTYRETLTLTPPPTGPEEAIWREVVAPPGSGTADIVVDVASYLTVEADPAVPARGWRVTIESPTGQRITDDANTDGEAVFPSLTGGTYMLREITVAGSPGMVVYSSPITATAGQRTVRLFKIDVEQKICEIVGGFIDDYCELTSEEKRFLREHPVLTPQFAYAAREAIQTTWLLFDGVDDQLDATKANAFQHSFWTALMTKRVYDNTILDRESLALAFATAHESESRKSRDPITRKRSRMDLHNNKVGWLHAKAKESNRKSDYRLCTAMRRATVNGRLGLPRDRASALLAAPARQLARGELRARAATEPVPHQLTRAAVAAFGVTAVVATAGCGAGDCADFRWEREAWLAPDATRPFDGDSRRQQMLERLQACDRLEGRTRADVRRLFGRPERVGRLDDGALLWVWALGRRGSIGVETEYLHVVFAGARVAEVTTV